MRVGNFRTIEGRCSGFLVHLEGVNLDKTFSAEKDLIDLEYSQVDISALFAHSDPDIHQGAEDVDQVGVSEYFTGFLFVHDGVFEGVVIVLAVALDIDGIGAE